MVACPTMQKLKSKVALVTGGASGLGKAIAHRLASDGARIAHYQATVLAAPMSYGRAILYSIIDPSENAVADTYK